MGIHDKLNYHLWVRCWGKLDAQSDSKLSDNSKLPKYNGETNIQIATTLEHKLDIVLMGKLSRQLNNQLKQKISSCLK